MVKRAAFTLIELIVTIVVLGFIVSALPTILIQDAKSREMTINQEAIYAATAKMAQILSYKWDEASSQDNETVSIAKVLDINSAIADSELERNTTRFRMGHFQVTGRRYMYSTETNSSALGMDADDNGTADDLDDFHNTAANLVTIDTESDGYKRTYTINVQNSYAFDNANYANSSIGTFEFDLPTIERSNIKRILITVGTTINGEATTLFTLRSYSSNIGESEVVSRTFN